MAHFAKLDKNNLVTEVLVVNNSDMLDKNGKENEAVGIAFLNNLLGKAKWVQTSYNGNIRKNYAGIGYTYDSNKDAFISPKPNADGDWIFNEDTCNWDRPLPYPEDGKDYHWLDGNWVEIEIIQL